MTELLKPKWCTYCRKDNHNDSECWSTRADNGPHYPASVTLPFGVEYGVFKRAFEQWKKDVAQGMHAQDKPAGQARDNRSQSSRM